MTTRHDQQEAVPDDQLLGIGDDWRRAASMSRSDRLAVGARVAELQRIDRRIGAPAPQGIA